MSIFNTPNKERIKLWIDALRSGDYKQTTGCLVDGNGYCCLGVGTEVAIKNGLPYRRVGLVGYRPESDPESEPENTVLPKAVADWYGVSENPDLLFPYPDYDPDYPEDGPEFYDPPASEVNDEWEFDFIRIAELLESKYLD